MKQPTPTLDNCLPRRMGTFDTLTEALDYAARGSRGTNFYSGRGELINSATYAEIRNEALEIAKKLITAGLDKGARVALIADTSADFICHFMGCQYAGLLPVPLPLPTSFGGREAYCQQLHRQMKNCSATAAIAPDSMTDLLVQAINGLKMKVAGGYAEVRNLPAEDVSLRLPGPNDISYLQYSSGSTRFPHGVTVTQRSLLSNCRSIATNGIAIQDDDRCVSWLPMYHDMGLVGCFLTALTCQVSVDYTATENFARRPLLWLSLISKNRGTISYSPSFGYELCARRANGDSLADLDLSSWRVAGIGADLIRPDVMRSFVEKFEPTGFKPGAFTASYGLAECTLGVSFARLGRGIEVDVVDERVLATENKAVAPKIRTKGEPEGRREVVNCGRVMPEFEVEIRDKSGRIVGEREVGTVFVRGPSVMNGYYNDPEATTKVLSEDGWLDTGDMGYRVDEYLFIVGRSKDLIILNGRNHWPQDIEWAAERIPGLRSGDSAAISLPGFNDEEMATLLVQCRIRDPEERQILSDRIREAVRQAVGIQCGIVFIPPRTLPRTSSGKISRSKAREEFLSGSLVPLDNPSWEDKDDMGPAQGTA